MPEHCSIEVTTDEDGTIQNFKSGVTPFEALFFLLSGTLPKKCGGCGENQHNCPIKTHQDAIRYRKTLRP